MNLQITGFTHATPDAVTIRFKGPDNAIQYKAGQHGSFTFKIADQEYTRMYSFHTSPRIDDDLAITVRAIDGGIVSTHLVKDGNASIDVKLNGVYGDFFVEPRENSERHLIMFAGGSGITPIISMIRTVLHHEAGSVVTLVYSNRNRSRIIFEQELTELENTYSGRLNVLHVLSDEPESDNHNVFYRGQLSRLIAKKIIKQARESVDLLSEIYVCGPFGFMQLVEEAALALGIDQQFIFKEHFFIPSETANNDWLNLPSRKVIVKREGIEQTVEAGAGKSILQAALESGMQMSFSCTEGQCGLCRAWLHSGKVLMRKNSALSEKEIEDGQVLLCQSFPETDNVVVEQRLAQAGVNYINISRDYTNQSDAMAR